MKGSARGQPCPDPRLGLSPPLHAPALQSPPRFPPGMPGSKAQSREWHGLAGMRCWARVALHCASVARMGRESPARSERVPGKGLRYSFQEEQGGSGLTEHPSKAGTTLFQQRRHTHLLGENRAQVFCGTW